MLIYIVTLVRPVGLRLEDSSGSKETPPPPPQQRVRVAPSLQNDIPSDMEIKSTIWAKMHRLNVQKAEASVTLDSRFVSIPYKKVESCFEAQ